MAMVEEPYRVKGTVNPDPEIDALMVEFSSRWKSLLEPLFNQTIKDMKLTNRLWSFRQRCCTFGDEHMLMMITEIHGTPKPEAEN